MCSEFVTKLPRFQTIFGFSFGLEILFLERELRV